MIIAHNAALNVHRLMISYTADNGRQVAFVGDGRYGSVLPQVPSSSHVATGAYKVCIQWALQGGERQSSPADVSVLPSMP